jgi:hypothetical protein
LVKPDSEAGRSHATAAASGLGDVPLVIYAIAAGILAVSTGTLIKESQQWGVLTDAVSLFAVACITVVAGISADSVLNWLIPQNRNPSRHS